MPRPKSGSLTISAIVIGTVSTWSTSASRRRLGIFDGLRLGLVAAARLGRRIGELDAAAVDHGHLSGIGIRQVRQAGENVAVVVAQVEGASAQLQHAARMLPPR